MNLRLKRLSEIVQTFASEEIMNFSQLKPHNHGIISIVRAEVTEDYAYADVFVSSQYEEKTLPKFLAESAKSIERRIGKEIQLRKTPHIRFRISKEQKSGDSILELIHSLDAQYGLSQDHSTIH